MLAIAREAVFMDGHNHAPDQYVSADGWALIWVCSILLVPAIFGVMFLPSFARLLVLSLGLGAGITFAILYTWATGHPASATAHVLDVLHIGPPRPVKH